jgi:crotonobetainyl-CoA:carnitine CoA-transferase CaiB-like acyl-CoA transferase
MIEGILSGVRVIDAATYIAAPAAATVMADFGAEVVKIERPPRGDPYRYLGQVTGMPVSEHNYCWMLDSRNKRSIALDLSVAEGREALIRLVARADVFITNFQASQLAKFRLAWDDLRAVNGRLVYASVTGYGESGPDAGRPGYDMTGYWARSGLMSFVHNGDSEPALSPAGFGDHPTSMALFGAIMMALYRRERTGRGSKVSTTLMACGAWSNGCMIQAALAGATFHARRTRRAPMNPLVNHYVSGDGRRFLFCLIEPDRDWGRLCRAVGREAWIGDARFATPALRRENSAELVALLDAEFAKLTMTEWSRRFAAHEVTWGAVPAAAELALDPQMIAEGLFREVEGSPVRALDSPIRVEGSAKVPMVAAPDLGRHTREVLAEAGYTPAEIDELIGKGAARE